MSEPKSNTRHFSADALPKVVPFKDSTQELLVHDLKHLLSLYDKNGDGQLDEIEMVKLQSDYEKMAKELLSKYDKNSDGILQEKEVESMMADLKNDPKRLHKALGFLALRRRYDTNRDGILDTTELIALQDDIKSTDLNVRYVGYTAGLAESIRYAAYTSDLGESARPLVKPAFVRASYGVSIAYVLGDVLYEGYKEKQNKEENPIIARTVIKRGIFQGLASLAFPAITIHTVVHQSEKYFHRIGRFQRWGPTIAGLSVVPALPFMFDHPVEHVMDWVFAKFWPIKSEHNAQGH